VRRHAPKALFVCGLLFLAWLFYPPQPGEVTAALLLGQRQFQSQRDAAGVPSRNGYLAPEWQPLWAPREGSSQPSKLLFLTRAAGALSPDTFPDLQRLRRLLRDQDGHVASTLESFEAVVEPLQREWVKEAFVPPSKRPSLLHPLPNMSVLGELSNGCSALAYQKLLSGQADDALRLGIAGLRLSTTLVRNGGMTWLRAGLQLRRVPLANWLRVVQSQETLHPRLVAALVEEIGNQQLAPDELQRALASELLAAEEFFRLGPAARNELQNTLEQREMQWLSVPGMLQRDRRIFHRQFAPLLRTSNDYWLSANEQLRKAGGSWFLGERSMIGRVILPDTYQPAVQVELARFELAAVHALLGLRLYEQEHGRLPRELADLRIAALAGFEWTNPLWNYDSQGRRVALRLPRPLIEGLGKTRLYREGDVQGELTADGLRYSL
jgi:hypothetical protein